MSKQPRALELAEACEQAASIADMSRPPIHNDWRREAAALLRSQHELIGELVEAIDAYFVTWANEGKKPGWCDRVEAATLRVSAAISKAKEQQ